MKRFVLSSFVLILFALSGKSQSDYLVALEDRSLRIDTLYWINPANQILISSQHPWKEWETVENFTFGKNRGDLKMITDLEALHPYFRDKINQLIQVCKSKGIEITVVESFRTKAKQAEYFGMGRKYTRSAGGKSKHQYGLACDVVPVVNGQPQWDDKVLWRKIGVEGEKLGLRWGGRWRTPYDPAHFEWTGGITTRELVAGTFPTPARHIYPCIEEDLQQLRIYWDAWEREQASLITATKLQTIASGQRP